MGVEPTSVTTSRGRPRAGRAALGVRPRPQRHPPRRVLLHHRPRPDARGRPRLGSAKEAKDDLATFSRLMNDAGSRSYVDAVLAAYLGDDAAGMKRLEEAIARDRVQSHFLVDAACAYSLASQAV